MTMTPAIIRWPLALLRYTDDMPAWVGKARTLAGTVSGSAAGATAKKGRK